VSPAAPGTPMPTVTPAPSLEAYGMAPRLEWHHNLDGEYEFAQVTFCGKDLELKVGTNARRDFYSHTLREQGLDTAAKVRGMWPHSMVCGVMQLEAGTGKAASAQHLPACSSLALQCASLIASVAWHLCRHLCRDWEAKARLGLCGKGQMAQQQLSDTRLGSQHTSLQLCVLGSHAHKPHPSPPDTLLTLCVLCTPPPHRLPHS
jgi:hypothetical protein